MIDIAHEKGSAEFEEPLWRLGLPCRIKNLESADFAFWGEGPDGTCRIGIERKTVDEMTSFEGRGRLTGHQLPRMTKRYRFRFLLIEGLTRVEPREGMLQQGRPVKNGQLCAWGEAGFRRGETFEAYLKFQVTLQLKAAITIIPTADRTATAHAVHAIYRWFQVDWEKHKSHLKVDEAHPDEALLDERTIRRQTFAQWPGVGWQRSAKVSQHFHSIADAVTASEDEWMQALGIKKGRKIVRRLVDTLHGRGSDDAKGG